MGQFCRACLLMATDKAFCARIANFVGYGVYINKRADGNWAPNEYRFALDQHAVSIKQHDEVLNPRESDLRGQLVDTSIAEVHGVSSIEGQVTTAVQCLESLKSYFALSEGHRFGIVETSYGSFRGPTSKRDLGFKYLLKAALNDVDMPLPSTFPIIRKLRNAIVHRGFIRESDAVTTHI